MVVMSMFAGRQVAHGQSDSFYYENGITETSSSQTEKTDLAKIIKEDNVSDANKITNTNSLLYKIRGFFKLNKDPYNAEEPAIAYVKMLINMALGFVSFISLILVIFAFYLILFSKGEDWVKKAKAILKWVAIAIVVMWLSRIIVSFLFGFVFTGAKQAII